MKPCINSLISLSFDGTVCGFPRDIASCAFSTDFPTSRRIGIAGETVSIYRHDLFDPFGAYPNYDSISRCLLSHIVHSPLYLHYSALGIDL